MQILGTRVLVLQDSSEEISPGGIILTDYSKKKKHTATVIEVGNEVRELEVGDRIIVKEFIGEKLILNGKEMVFLKEEDILGKITHDNSSSI